MARRPYGGHHHHGSGGGDDDRFPPNGDINRWARKLCANSNLAETYLNQTRALITQLSSNDSFTQYLQQKAHQIAYIDNDNDTSLITSNCTGYFNGLAAAQNADLAVQQQEKEYQNIANRLFKNIIKHLLDYNDSSSEDD